MSGILNGIPRTPGYLQSKPHTTHMENRMSDDVVISLVAGLLAANIIALFIPNRAWPINLVACALLSSSLAMRFFS